MKIKVFIENEAGSNQKNCFNETTLEYIKTVPVSRAYPFPYGFMPNTISGDGDNLDCFVLTNQNLTSRQQIVVEPRGLMEQFEDGVADHKILATLADEEIEITEEIKSKLADFVTHVFDHKNKKQVQAGNFYGQDKAEELIRKSQRTDKITT